MTVSLSINGRTVQAEAGQYVLQVAREAGIEIPTLCEHPDLEPVAACRICMVEVTHPDWSGWSGLMTACIYPAAEGLQIETNSARVQQARRGVLALLAARCPGSATIQDLAQRHGAVTDRLQLEPGGDDCILCGLCVRVCETYATGAIATCSRGSSKRVGTFADAPPDECVGCGGCALVCPTGNIHEGRGSEGYTIWERRFDTATCSVDETACLGCGRCEEACPFSVARVVLRATGRQAATIPAEHCRGCGACVGACPSGAITQIDPFCWPGLVDRLTLALRDEDPGRPTRRLRVVDPGAGRDPS
jgi:bidirectional [NiFe] hydrogenase diaphorase subunit